MCFNYENKSVINAKDCKDKIHLKLMWGDSRVVDANWNPNSSNRQVNVNANDASNVNSDLGFRPSRSGLVFL